MALLVERSSQVRAIVARHSGNSVAVFGSVARGDEGPHSDIDLLVEFGPGASLFDQVWMKDELEELLGCSVDVVSTGALLPEDSDILDDAVLL